MYGGWGCWFHLKTTERTVVRGEDLTTRTEQLNIYSKLSEIMSGKKLAANGIATIEEFVSKESAANLLKELKDANDPERAFSRNCAFPRIVSPNRVTYEVPDAANAFRSTNLLEVAVDIRDLLSVAVPGTIFKVTMISAARDHNPKPLKLHSDNLDRNSKGMYRAILYLNDVDVNNGAFRYVANSHLSENNSLENDSFTLTENLVDCTGAAGTLVIFNAYGIHGRAPCSKPRYSISFEFFPIELARRNNSVSILQGNLTRKVVENIDLFSIVGRDHANNHLYDDFKGKFYCPTSHSDFDSPKYTTSARKALLVLVSTVAARITPLGVQRLIVKAKSLIYNGAKRLAKVP